MIIIVVYCIRITDAVQDTERKPVVNAPFVCVVGKMRTLTQALVPLSKEKRLMADHKNKKGKERQSCLAVRVLMTLADLSLTASLWPTQYHQ